MALAYSLNVLRHLHPGLVSLFWIFGNGPRNQSIQLGRELRIERCDRQWIAIHNFEADRRSAVPLKRPEAGEHAVEDYAHRKQVRPRIRIFTTQLLRSHVGGASQHLTRY